MEAQTLMIGHPPKYLPMSCFRGSSHTVSTVWGIVILSCILFQLAARGSCFVAAMQESREDNDACKSIEGDSSTCLSNAVSGGFISSGVQETSKNNIALGNAGSNSDLFFFPSTLHGFSPESYHVEATELEDYASKVVDPLPLGVGISNSSWSSDNGMSKLLNGRAVSCSLTSVQDADRFSYIQAAGSNQNDLSSCRGSLSNHRGATNRQKNSEMIMSVSFDGSLPPYVEIDPPVLDWGENYLYVPSFAFLTVSHTWNDSILHIYQPFSTDTQFFPCNFTEAFLGPGEASSICFIFLPKQMGLSIGHLILQTNSGGFLVQVKGFAAEFPFGQPLLGLDISSNGRWRHNLSLFNPFDESIYVEELAVWVSVSAGNTSINMEATCRLHDPWGSSGASSQSIKDWFLVKNDHPDSSLMAMRPHRNWEISPHNSETIVEIDFSFGLTGKIFGAFCMQLMRLSQDQADIVMVPVEAEIDGSASTADITGLLAVSLAALDGAVAVALRNSGSCVVRVVKITEVADLKHFQIKYMEDLLLFPGTVTQIAIITCTDLPDVVYASSRTSNMNKNCKLLVQTNGSRTQIEIPCQDIVYLCTRHEDFSVALENSPNLASGNRRTGSLNSGIELPLYSKALETTMIEEVVLQNWKSQGTNSDISVLEEHEVLFPVVQVGNHFSKWIRVQNPSQQPVIMQLILNSGEIIDGCRTHIDTVQLLSSAGLVQSDSVNPSRYGFSLSGSAQTEAYVHPHQTAYLGPITFHPSNRCEWRSSALIRNNLSGVEWFSLQGRGGSYSLALLEKSEPVQNLEFKPEVPDSLNFSLPGITADITLACSNPMKKELHAKNTGDLPLEVKKVKVSGTDCGLDGFLVHNCTPFTLDPGESTLLHVSYKSKFLSPVVHGDLELGLASGIIVIPMKAGIPLYMLEQCKRSAFWVRVKKFGAILLVVPLICFAVFFFYPQVISFGPRFCSFESKRDSISITNSIGKSSSFKGRNKSYLPPKVDHFPNSVGDDSVGQADSLGGSQELRISTQDTKSGVENSVNSPILTNNDQEKVFTTSSQLGGLTVNVGKEKGRRRRKRKGAGAALTGLFEVSSSQSGNSTPSSPLSPTSSVTPRKAWPLSPDGELSVDAKNRFVQENMSSRRKSPVFHSEVEQRKEFSSAKTANKPVLLPSATFPCAGRPSPGVVCSSSYLASTATIAPHARAPGSKLYNEKVVKSDEKIGPENQFTYDIWGDHFSALHLISRLKDDSSMMARTINSDSESFFVRGPQTLMMKYLQESVSSSQAG